MEQSESPERTTVTTLDRVGLKRRCRIVGVRATGALRKRVLAMGLVPGAEVVVAEVAPFLGPLTIEVGSARHAIGRNLADLILVVTSPVEP